MQKGDAYVIEAEGRVETNTVIAFDTVLLHPRTLQVTLALFMGLLYVKLELPDAEVCSIPFTLQTYALLLGKPVEIAVKEALPFEQIGNNVLVEIVILDASAVCAAILHPTDTELRVITS